MSKQAIAGDGVKRINAFSVPPESIKLIDDPEHPLYDERVKLPTDEALVKNVMHYGVREPVLVRKEGDTIVCVAGRQRVKAACEANKRLKSEGKETISVPIMRQEGEEADLYGVMILENELRTDDKVLGKARKAAKMLGMAKTKAEVALTFGVTQATVDNWCKLLAATAKVRKAVEDEKITPTAAYSLAKLAPEEQDKALDELLEEAEEEGGKTTARRAAEKTSAKKGGKKDTSRPSIKKVAKLREALANALKEMAKKDDAYAVTETCIEVLDWVTTGESTEFVEIAFAGLASSTTKPKE